MDLGKCTVDSYARRKLTSKIQINKKNNLSSFSPFKQNKLQSKQILIDMVKKNKTLISKRISYPKFNEIVKL